jgi:Ser/Thr protein kinase RdoA (MazF antagonist)
VKTLPDNPHLDHLRRQAKDLLAGLRDSDPGTSLADAQALLAEQYGFRTWTDLKAEVDRRQDSAVLADPALAQAVADRYRLGTVTGPMRSLAPPDEMGRRWSLWTDQGHWAARTVDTLFPPTDGESDAALQEAAAGAGVLLAPPVRGASGAVVEPVGGHRWRVTGWLGSGPPLVAPVSAPVAGEVGGILARVHGLGMPAERVCPWHSTRFASLGWSELADKAVASSAGWAPVLADAVAALVDLDRIGDLDSTGEPVLTHNSLLPANVRRGADGRLVVSGWEHADGLPPGWELAEVLTHWTVNPDGGVNAAAARAMAAGYREVAGALPPLELAMFRGTAVSLSNYTSGQVAAALEADGEQAQRFADRNIRHLLGHLPRRRTFELLLAAVGTA